MDQKYIIEPLDKKNHISETFTCGVEELDIYLREKAGQEIKRNVTAVYILRKNTSSKIIGYFTLSSSSIELTELPPELAKKLPKYKTVGVILLGRLARDSSVHAMGMGEYLLMDAITRSYELSKKLGSFAVVVDAKNEKVKSFYKEYGFIQFSQRPLCLFLPMSSIKKLLS